MEDAFPRPDHDHQQCVRSLLARAEQQCHERNLRFTPQRRRVLEIIAGSHEALGAYEILSRLAGGERAPAPVVVYRALEFLVREGLVHRMESLNAYVACAAETRGHRAQFLICQRCRSVAELRSPAIDAAIHAGAEAAGFSVLRPVVEIGGLCRACERGGDDTPTH
jgi:Fur family transcriptional regulator, zinc uptake regulator